MKRILDNLFYKYHTFSRVTTDFEILNKISLPKKSAINVMKLRSSVGKMSDTETKIQELLQNNLTAKHKTRSLAKPDTIYPISYLEAQLGKNYIKRFTNRKKYPNNSFWTIGLKYTPLPTWLNSHDGYEIELNLPKLLIKRPDIAQNLFVSNHLSDLEKNFHLPQVTIDSKKFSIITNWNTKEKKYTYDSQSISVEFNDEIFLGRDILEGISLQFIQSLRLFANDNFYNEFNKYNEFAQIRELSKLMAIIMPPKLYPEGKLAVPLNLYSIKECISITKSPSVINANKHSIGPSETLFEPTLKWQLSHLTHQNVMGLDIKSGIDFHYADYQIPIHNNNAFRFAAYTHNIDAMQMLISNIGGLNKYNDLLLLASSYKDAPQESTSIAMFKFLLSQGTDIKQTPANSSTPLINYVRNASSKGIDLCLESGAPINAQFKDKSEPEYAGFTALHFLLQLSGNKYKYIEKFLEKGADPFISSETGITPIDLAKYLGDEKALDIFKKYKFQIPKNVIKPLKNHSNTVVAIIKGELEDGKKVVLMARKIGKDGLDNTLMFPGGFKDIGEDYLEAAIREVKEETNIDLSELIKNGNVKPWFIHKVVKNDENIHHRKIFIEFDLGKNILKQAFAPGDDIASLEFVDVKTKKPVKVAYSKPNNEQDDFNLLELFYSPKYFWHPWNHFYPEKDNQSPNIKPSNEIIINHIESGNHTLSPDHHMQIEKIESCYRDKFDNEINNNEVGQRYY
ncbi:MAG: hypothetical protein BGO27_04990 [Alphaproteobacteria bacterium 33-17]|mgnify:CR=1 FL=1|nr:MAG: hypothetical protein BGO27_04990 [Alphaproteobacteria bacterium 33-17]